MIDQTGQPKPQIHQITELGIKPRAKHSRNRHNLRRTLRNAAARCHIAFDRNLGGNGFHDLHDGNNRTVADKVIRTIDADKHLCLLSQLKGTGIIGRDDDNAIHLALLHFLLCLIQILQDKGDIKTVGFIKGANQLSCFCGGGHFHRRQRNMVDNAVLEGTADHNIHQKRGNEKHKDAPRIFHQKPKLPKKPLEKCQNHFFSPALSRSTCTSIPG